jgi:serine/threonine protein kinase
MATEKLTFRSAFSIYSVEGKIGEGGSGIIYKVKDESNNPFALKLLDPKKATRNRIKRFKNEIYFCSNIHHENIVCVVDSGPHVDGKATSPFYVMNLYIASLRELISKGIHPDKVLIYFDQILSGVEAAHIRRVFHRDLKPENILYDNDHDRLLIADFGIAHFEEDDLFTAVATRDNERLANFQYAAPEQRTPGSSVDHRADIYALGLILNEMFTKKVPLGSGYKTVGQELSDYSYLDDLISAMIRQSPDERPNSIEKVKGLLIGYKNAFITRQKINELDKTVIPTTSIDDDSLIIDPIRLIGFDWKDNRLELTLNQPINPKWIQVLQTEGGFTHLVGYGPGNFSFAGNKAVIGARADIVQTIIDYFKSWLPKANEAYKRNLLKERREKDEAVRRGLEAEREAQKIREKVLREIKI